MLFIVSFILGGLLLCGLGAILIATISVIRLLFGNTRKVLFRSQAIRVAAAWIWVGLYAAIFGVVISALSNQTDDFITEIYFEVKAIFTSASLVVLILLLIKSINPVSTHLLSHVYTDQKSSKYYQKTLNLHKRQEKQFNEMVMLDAIIVSISPIAIALMAIIESVFFDDGSVLISDFITWSFFVLLAMGVTYFWDSKNGKMFQTILTEDQLDQISKNQNRN